MEEKVVLNTFFLKKSLKDFSAVIHYPKKIGNTSSSDNIVAIKTANQILKSPLLYALLRTYRSFLND